MRARFAAMTAWFRADPRRSALAVTTAVLAIGAGAAFAFIVGNTIARHRRRISVGQRFRAGAERHTEQRALTVRQSLGHTVTDGLADVDPVSLADTPDGGGTNAGPAGRGW